MCFPYSCGGVKVLKDKVIAGIVLYNPEIMRLSENIKAVLGQVDSLILVNNGSTNIGDIKHLIETNNWKIEYVDLKSNKGIAYALNVILHKAVIGEYEWFLTIDQDSVVSENLITTYERYIGYNKLGIISCEIIDRNFNEIHNNANFEVLDYVITSGSLVNTSICKKVNGFDSKMFIDFVDFDLCAKVREAGYNILRTYETNLLHEVGHSTPKMIGKRQYIAYNHNPERVYYFYRNGMYFIRKHKKKNSINAYAWRKNLLRRFVLITLYEKQKIKKYKMICSGILDSKNMTWKECGYSEMKDYEKICF